MSAFQSSCYNVYKAPDQCSFARLTEDCDAPGFIPYNQLYFCSGPATRVFLIFLSAILIPLVFHLLGVIADKLLRPSLLDISERLRVSPGAAGVTFLAFGNGAPDVFSSVAAVRAGFYDLALGSLVGSGLFISSVVMGSVVFVSNGVLSLKALTRDAGCFLLGVAAVFTTTVISHVTIWVPIVLFGGYSAYVLLVVTFDICRRKGLVGRTGSLWEMPISPAGDWDQVLPYDDVEDEVGDRSSETGFKGSMSRVFTLVEAPFVQVWRFTVPSVDYSDWDWTANVTALTLCPTMCYLCSDYSVTSWISIGQVSAPGVVVFLLVGSVLAGMVYFVSKTKPTNPEAPSFSLSFRREGDGPITEQIPIVRTNENGDGNSTSLRDVTSGAGDDVEDVPWSRSGRGQSREPKLQLMISLLSFGTSALWINAFAEEMVAIVTLWGLILQWDPAIMGLTVIAWGNSVADLITDTTLARRGHSKMAVAACYAGPFFNLMVGLGLGLILYFVEGKLAIFAFVPSRVLVVCLVFLMTTLSTTILWSWINGGKIPKFFGVYLVLLYMLALVMSTLVLLGAL